MSLVKCGGRLGNNRKNSARGENLLALENGAQCFARHQLHDQIGTAFFFAVVKDIGDALVVDECCVLSLGPKALPEAGVTEVLLFQNLDGDVSANDGVICLPHLAHSANRDAGNQLIP